MIRMQRKDGAEIQIETCNDPAKVERLLNRCLQPETCALLKKELILAEEIFFEFTGINKEEFPMVRHHLIHLDSHPSAMSDLTRGNFYIIFYVHRDRLASAEEMAKVLKHRFKDANDWHDTNEHAVESNKFFKIPPLDI